MTESATGSYKQALDQIQEMMHAHEFGLALEQVNAILEVHPRDARTNFLKGVALRNLGEHSQALELFQALSSGTRGVGQVYQELGLTLHALSRTDEAIAALRTAVNIDSKLAASWQLLGELLYREDNVAEAEAAIRQQLAVSHRHPGIVQALELVQREKYGMAEGICRDYLLRHPDDVTVLRLLAEIGIKLGVRHDPITLLERCLKLAPDYHLARNTYANALSKGQRYQDALKEIDYLESVEPTNPSHSVLAAAILVMVGDYELAAQRYQQLLERMPGHAQLWTSYGHALKTLGSYEDAVSAYRSAIMVRADLGEAYWSLANLKTFRFSSAEVKSMREMAGQSELHARDLIPLSFALGKALEDQEQYDESFDFYAIGNDTKCKQVGYDAEETTAETQALINACSAELISNKRDYGCSAPDPIFIVGLPRSGSTLLEQILASHSQVDGTSELREIISIARRLGGKRNRKDQSLYPAVLADLTADQCRDLGEEYLQRTRVQRQGAPFFIDKMPNNFQHVALISMILPNAKIIDARRHPMATCFSGYKQLFAAGQTFTYNQSDIARYYSDYVMLMKHWDAILPGKVLTVKYEAVIADTQREVQRILDYCGLEFEQACLRFYDTRRAIRTASSEQVRQPIYGNSVAQWRNFEHHLGPMKGQLEGLIGRYES